jgi:hypothetical protein
MIQVEPNESSNLARAGVMPNSGQHLAIHQIVEIELLDERADYKNFGQLPQVHISLLSRITKERRVPQGEGCLPMPLSWIPGETVDEAGHKNPK